MTFACRYHRTEKTRRSDIAACEASTQRLPGNIASALQKPLYLRERGWGEGTGEATHAMPTTPGFARPLIRPWQGPFSRRRRANASPYGCTTVIVAGVLRPTPRSSGRYMSSTSEGGTV